jgi:hypothetical protein
MNYTLSYITKYTFTNLKWKQWIHGLSRMVQVFKFSVCQNFRRQYLF